MFRINSTKKGFTLVEVIIVLVIIAVLVAIVAPTMTGWIDRAGESSALGDARAVLLAAEAVLVILYGQAPETIGKLDGIDRWPPYEDKAGINPEEEDIFNPTNLVINMTGVSPDNVKKIVSKGVRVVELVYEKGNCCTTYIKGDGFSFKNL